MSELNNLSLSEVSDLLAAGTISSVELVETNLRAIEKTEPIVHAYANVLAEEALAAARLADAELAAGDRRGPLHGVPIGIKDNIYTKRYRHRKRFTCDGRLRARLRRDLRTAPESRRRHHHRQDPLPRIRLRRQHAAQPQPLESGCLSRRLEHRIGRGGYQPFVIWRGGQRHGWFNSRAGIHQQPGRQ